MSFGENILFHCFRVLSRENFRDSSFFLSSMTKVSFTHFFLRFVANRLYDLNISHSAVCLNRAIFLTATNVFDRVNFYAISASAGKQGQFQIFSRFCVNTSWKTELSIRSIAWKYWHICLRIVTISWKKTCRFARPVIFRVIIFNSLTRTTRHQHSDFDKKPESSARIFIARKRKLFHRKIKIVNFCGFHKTSSVTKHSCII